MIRLLRKIRHRLLEESSYGMYMLYAGGEVLLVVIGILLAFQIDNWNEDRKERQQETVILKQLHSEFTSNLDQLDHKIAAKEDIMNSVMQLFRYIDDPQLRNKDSIDYHLARTMPYSTFDPIVYDLAGSGSLMLIRNNYLKQILSLWGSEILDVKEDEFNWKDYRNQIYIPFLVEHYQLRTIRTKATSSNALDKYLIEGENDSGYTDYDMGFTKHPEDFSALLNHPDFEDHMERALGINNFARSQALTLRKRMLEILEMLEKEINNNE